MTLVADFVKDALLLIQATDARQPVKAVDMTSGIRALNRLVRRLEANGTALGWSDVANPSDALPLPPEAEAAVLYALAIDLAPSYGTTPMPEVVGRANDYMNDLRRDQMVATPIQPILDAPLPERFGWGGFRNGWDG